MNTYMANVRYRKEYYMEDDDDGKILEKNFTISADDETEAENKVYAYFNDKTDPYCVVYNVLDVDIWTHLE